MKTLTKTLVILLLTTFITSSCINFEERMNEMLPEDDIYSLRVNMSRLASLNGLYIKLVKIEDNRCPYGLRCDSSGSVNVEYRFINVLKGIDTTIVLNNMYKPCDSICGQYIELLKVFPYKVNGTINKEKDYIISSYFK